MSVLDALEWLTLVPAARLRRPLSSPRRGQITMTEPYDYDQQSKPAPSLVPVGKVASAGVTGAAGVLLVYIAGLLHLDMAPEVAAAAVAVLAFFGGYFKR